MKYIILITVYHAESCHQHSIEFQDRITADMAYEMLNRGGPGTLYRIVEKLY